MDCCQKCGVEADVNSLDGKPSSTAWLTLIRMVRGQQFMLSYAANHGYDFDRLECAQCYGPGYEEMP